MNLLALLGFILCCSWLPLTQADDNATDSFFSREFVKNGGLDVASKREADWLIGECKTMIAQLFGKTLRTQKNNNRLADMPFGPQLAKSLYESLLERMANRAKRKAVDFDFYSDANKWGTTIPYKVDTSLESSTSVIEAALDSWSSQTCLEFEHHSLEEPMGDTPHLVFIAGDGCYSYLGQQIVIQPITLDISCWNNDGDVAHEIGHALGLIHEHQRPDRNDYISINYNNIDPDLYAAYDENLIKSILWETIPFDFGSLMMYSPKNVDGDVVIETVDPNYQQAIGQSIGPSFYDLMAINMIYCLDDSGTACNGHDPDCQNGGYADPLNDCLTCICPVGYDGDFCEEVAPSTGCTPDSSQVFSVTSSDWQCVQTSNYGTINPYTVPSLCNFVFKAPDSTFTIEGEFQGDFGIACNAMTDGGCLHWVEVKYEDPSLPGARFCCNTNPDVMVTAQGEMVLSFNALHSGPFITMIPEEEYQVGFQFCYRLKSSVNQGIDDCLGNPCSNGGTCHDEDNSFTCDCVPGFIGSTCTEIDECASSPCVFSSRCDDKVNGFECICLFAFYGPTCAEYDACISNPCQNDGTCSDQVETFSCQCPPEFSGELCEVHACENHACVNEAACIASTSSKGYSCVCPAGVKGKFCQKKDSKELGVGCENHACSNGATCIATPGKKSVKYICKCAAGFKGKYCQKIRPKKQGVGCENHACSNGATCIATPGRKSKKYICKCVTGFKGKYCKKIDYQEQGVGCENHACINGATCVDSSTSKSVEYICVCALGFKGKYCENIASGEIAAANMAARGSCLNHACLNDAACIPSSASKGYTCLCQSPFHGKFCQSISSKEVVAETTTRDTE